jgi:hypothetical protein
MSAMQTNQGNEIYAVLNSLLPSNYETAILD